MVPRGQMNLQKGLFIRIAATMKISTIAIFTMNNGPAIALIDLSKANRGSPASRPPAGQSLQNIGSPMVKAAMITRPINTVYLMIPEVLCPIRTLSFLGPSLILKRISCKNPNGHAHPHVIRPMSAPVTVKRPTRAKGNLLCPTKCWSDPIGQAMTASGHA